MHAIVMRRYGGLENLRQSEVPDPRPGPGDCLVRVKAAGVNPLDWKMRKGSLRAVYPQRLPAIPGHDVAGVVESTGPGVTRFEKGDEVFGMTAPGHGGAYAELARVPASQLARKPSNVSFEMAAAIPLAGLTAYQALRDFGQMRGMMRVLINGVSGGVGLFALQLARLHGARVVGVCSEKNTEFIQSMQAEKVFDYRKVDPFKGAPAYDLIFDAVGSGRSREALRVLKPGGVYVSTRPGFHLLWCHYLGNVWSREKAYYCAVQPRSEDLEDLARWLQAGKILVETEATYPLSEVRSAHARSETGRVRGKLVLSLTS